MQSWIFIVLGIIILILVLVLLAAIKRGRNEKRLVQLNASFEKLTNQPIYKTIDQLDAMNLAGGSQEILEKRRQEYYHLLNDTFATLYQTMYDAEAANQKFSLFVANRLIHEAEEQLTGATQDTEQITAALESLRATNEHNQAESKALLHQYQQMRKLILTKSFTFGPAVDELENRLAALDDEFDQAKKLTSKGDHLEAKKTLANIKEKMAALTDLTKRIPPRYQELVTEFPDQLLEIDKVYRQMLDQHYHFTDPDIGQSVILLKNKIQIIDERLGHLEIDFVEQNNQSLSQSIDELYQRLQDEMDARKQLPPLQKTTFEFLNHATVQTQKLIEALDHLNQSYVLTHHELDDAQEMQRQIADMQRQYDVQVQAVADQTVIATEAVNLFNKINEHLTTTEQRQYKISNDVANLFEGEKVAKQGVQQFVLDLKEIQRDVERLRLPGLPKDYLDYFNMVKDEIVKLEQNLNQVQINIEDITKQLIVTQEDLNNLSQKSKDLRDAAVLTEQALQYANRYTYANAEIAAAADEAKELYTKAFDYPTALDTIATALEQIEPGSFKRIEDSYYHANDQK